MTEALESQTAESNNRLVSTGFSLGGIWFELWSWKCRDGEWWEIGPKFQELCLLTREIDCVDETF